MWDVPIELHTVYVNTTASWLGEQSTHNPIDRGIMQALFLAFALEHMHYNSSGHGNTPTFVSNLAYPFTNVFTNCGTLSKRTSAHRLHLCPIQLLSKFSGSTTIRKAC